MKLTKEQAFKTSVELGLIVETHYGCFGPFSKMGDTSRELAGDISVELNDPYANEMSYDVTPLTPDGHAFCELMGGT